MKPPYRLCWECNRQFRGSHCRRVTLMDGREAFVHVLCADEMWEYGRIKEKP